MLFSFIPHDDKRDTAGNFESAFEELGTILGFQSSRPEKATRGAGPDNLWAIGSGEYLIVECKSEATVEKISKKYCDQLGGSTRWFSSEYKGENYQLTPVMVYPTNVLDSLATPVADMRVITPKKLESLKKQVRSLITGLVQGENWKNMKQIENLLTSCKLRGCDFVKNYTLPCK